MAKPENQIELPRTVRVTHAARSFAMPPKEFRNLLARHQVPVMRPSPKRECIRESDYHELCTQITVRAVGSTGA